MKMSDLIAECISEMLLSGGGVAELQRKSLAKQFDCVPSQINYVIETRFTPEHGYLVESQRGGGGFIRIVRIMNNKQQALLEIAQGIANRLPQSVAIRMAQMMLSAELLTQRECRLLLAACSDKTLAAIEETKRDQLRAIIFRGALTAAAAS